jgi:AcrR family transcriptional regulator
VPRSGLNREAVVDAAARLADTEGLERLTLQRLAADLGVQPSSLFNHINGLADLHRQLQLRGLRELGRRVARAAVGLPDGEAIQAAAIAVRGFAQEHPGLYYASLPTAAPADPEVEAAAAEFAAIFFDVIRHYGFGEAEAVHAVRGFYSLVHGFIALERRDRFNLPIDHNDSFRWLLRLYVESLDRRTGRAATNPPMEATS